MHIFLSVFTVVFWTGVAALAYANALYPALITVISLFVERPVSKKQTYPFVSVIIPLHNEERVIRDKIRNLNEVLYPRDRHEVIFASDGSTDGTCAAVTDLMEDRFVLLEYAERRGKAAVLSDAVKVARGEVLIFSDASGMLNREAIGAMTSNFHDANVGAVLGVYRVVKEASGIDRAEERYWDFELFLKKRESLVWTTLGGHGALYGVRKDLFEPVSPGIINDDFVIPARISLKGYRTVYEDGSVLTDVISTELPQEINRRIRIAYGNWQQMFVLWPKIGSSPAFLVWQFVSHKVLRSCEGIIFLFIAAGSFILPGGAYRMTAVAIGALAALSLLGLLSLRVRVLGGFRIFLLFTLGIYAQVVGTVRFFLGKRVGW